MHPRAPSCARWRTPSHRRPPALALVPLVLGFGGVLAVARALPSNAAPPPALVVAAAPTSSTSPPPLPVLDLTSARVDAAGRVTAPWGDATAVLTRDAALERELRGFVDGRAPYAATVLLDVRTGRVLAMAESSTRGNAAGLALRPMARAASVFKIVTTSALLQAGVSPAERVCIHGGFRRMQPQLLVDDAHRDRTCTSLGAALASSQNVAIAKLALAYLDPDRLRAEARRWGFDEPLPLDVDARAEASAAAIPDDPFGFANAAAGFGDVKISALHGALLASIVANAGMLVPPRLVESVDGAAAAPRARAATRAVDAATAGALRAMMVDTVKSGTARRTFASAPRLSVSVAGKTGSLADYDTGLETTWFVGFAPVDNPEVAVASVVMNEPVWHVKATLVAKEALRSWLRANAPARRSDVVALR